MGKRQANTRKEITRIARGVGNAIKSTYNRTREQMATLGKNTKAGDDTSNSSTNQLLAVLLGCGITGLEEININNLKKKISKDKTIFGKVESIAKYYEDLKKKEKEKKTKPGLKPDQSAVSQKDFYAKLTEFISGEGAQQFSKDFCKLIDGVNSLADHFIRGGEKKEEEKEKTQLDVVLSANDNNAEKLVENIKDITENKDAVEKLNNLEKLTSKEGPIQTIADNMGELAQNTDKINAYKSMAEKMDEANDAMKTATDKCDAETAAKQTTSFEGMKDMMIAVVGVAILLAAIGLLSEYIDYSGIVKFTITLGIFLFTIGEILGQVKENFEINKEGAEGALILVGGCALIMLLGGAIMDYINLANLFLFTVTLGGFLYEIGWVLGQVGENLERDIKTAEGALIIVAGAALIMFLGAAIVPLIEIDALAQFTFILGGFLWAIGKVLKWVGKGFGTMTKRAVWALAIVAGAALIMFLGAAIMPLIDMGQLLLFTATLGGFLLAIGVVLWAVGGVFNVMSQNALYALALVAGAALIMFLGSAIMPLIDTGQLVLFTVTLSGFLLAIGGVLTLFIPVFESAKEGAKDAAILIGVAAAVLLIGGFVMRYINEGDIILFTTLLDMLLLGVGLSFRLVQNVHDMESKATGMVIVVGLCGSIMLIAGFVLSKHPEIIPYIPIFVGLLDLLLVGVGAVMAILGAFEKWLSKGEKLTRQISEICLIGSAALLALAFAGKVAGGWENLLIYVGIFVAALGVIALFAGIMGANFEVLALGILSLLALSGAILVASGAFFVLAQVMKELSDVPAIDTELIINNVSTLIAISTMLTPLIFTSPMLLAVSGVLLIMSKALSAISETVADIAELKIAQDWDPKTGRPRKYRKLKTTDFANAGVNVGLIVNTLTKAIMKVYKANPSWYDSGIKIGNTSINPFGLLGQSPLEKVISQSAKLGKLISAIADGLKDYADLKFPSAWDPKTGKAIKFKVFTNQDFKNAANNVSYVVTTLTKAIMKVYDKNPDWYKSDLGKLAKFDIFGIAKTPLEKVISQSSKLEKLISSIADGLKDYADLKFAIAWDPKTGKPIKYRVFNNQDFRNATKNITHVVTTLTKAIMKLYKDNPTWYENDLGKFDIFGIVKTPLEKVISQSSKLQKLMSGIAEGVKSWATLQVPDKWDPKTGKPIHYLSIDDNAPADAASNVIAIVSVMSAALAGLYEDHQDWYEGNGTFAVIGLGGSSPLEKVISQSLNLQKLMTGIAEGVKAWATLQVPDQWDSKTGKPIHYKDIKETDPAMAAFNVSLVVTTIFNALANIANGPYKDMFVDEGGFLGMGSSNKISKVLNSALQLQKLMSGMAEGVRAWATMQIPDQWDPKTGKPIHYKDMNMGNPKTGEGGDPAMAALNIKNIINTLGQAVIDSYKEEWHEDKTIFGKIGLDSPGNTKFSKIINANLKLSQLIGSVAKGLQEYAKLQIPKRWDPKTGKPIEFERMSGDDIIKAKDNIKEVITKMGESMMEVYGKHDKWFEDKSIFGKIGIDMGGTPFAKVVNVNLKLSNLITNVAKGLQEYAKLEFPKRWNEDGEPVEFVRMTDDEIQQAGTNIGKVLENAGNAIMSVYHSDAAKKDKWFESTSIFDSIFGTTNSTPFVRVVSVNLKLSELITNLAKGMQEMAKLRLPDDWDPKTGKPIHFIEMEKKHFTKAGENIGEVVETLGKALIKTYDLHNDWYTIKTDKNGNLIEGSSKLQLTINSNHKLGELIKNMAEGIKSYADLDFAGITEDMSAAEKVQLVQNTFDEAANNVQSVCTTLAKAVMGIANDPQYSKWFTEIVDTTIVKHTFGKDDIQKTGTGRTPFGNVVGSMSKLGELIADVSEGISQYASMEMPGPDGTVIPLKPSTFIMAGAVIKQVLKTVGQAVMDIYKEKPEMFSPSINSVSFNSKTPPQDRTPFAITIASLSKMTSMISALGKGLVIYSSYRVPTAWDTNGVPTEYMPLSSQDLTSASNQIANIVSTIGGAIAKAYNTSPSAFATDFNGSSPAANVSKSLNQIVPFIGTIGSIIKRYAFGKFLIWHGAKDAYGQKVYKEETLTSKDVIDAGKRITDICLAIAGTISEVYNKNTTIFSFGDKSPGMAIAKSMDVMGPAIGAAAIYIGSFKEKFEQYKLNDTILKTIKDKMVAVCANIAALFVLLSSTKHSEYKTWGIKIGGGNFFSADDTFATVVGKYGKKLKSQLKSVLTSLTNIGILTTAVAKFCDKFFTGEYKDKFIKATRNLNIVIGAMISTFAAVSNIMVEFNNLNEGKRSDAFKLFANQLGIGKSSNTIGLEAFAKKAPMISKNLGIGLGIISTFANRILDISATLSAIQTLSGGQVGGPFIPVMELVYTFRYAMQAITAEFADLGNPFSSLSFFKDISKVEKLQEDFLVKVILLSKGLREISGAAIAAQRASGKGFVILAQGISNIARATARVKNSKQFAQQTTQLGRYIRSINSIKLENLKELHKFVQSVNKLASKMGNLDKLTEALGKKLAGELKMLTKQLKEAQKTIDKAEKMQDKRKRQIDDSIKKIEHMMKEHMVVDIVVDGSAKKKD